MILRRLLPILFLFALTVQAQPSYKQQCADIGGTWSNFKGRCDLTGRRHPWSDKRWWAGIAVIVIDHALDASSTMGVQHRCPDCVETNPILGPHPSAAQVWGLDAGAILFYSGLHYVEWYAGHDDPNKYWRFASQWTIPIIDASFETPAIANNFGIGTEPWCLRGPNPNVSCIPGATLRIRRDWLRDLRRLR
jgi:hypothetical protein